MNIFYAMPKDALLERLKVSFEEFKKDHGRYPASYEIITGNKYVFPSTKTIDRKFGGVKKLRVMLGLDVTNYSSGEHRSKMVKDVLLPRAIKSEGEFYKKLLKIVPRNSIHQHESYSFNVKVLSDFVLDIPGSRVGVDIFYANSYGSMSGCISAKLRKLKKIGNEQVFLVSVSDNISDDDIKKYLERRKTEMPNNIKIMTSSVFLSHLQNLI